MRNRWSTFEISDLILDLDAEDNKYVRPFNQEDDGKFEHWSRKQARDREHMNRRIANFEEESRYYNINFNKLRENPFSCWVISDVDLFSVALRGSLLVPRDKKSRRLMKTTKGLNRDQIINNVLNWNGVQHRIRYSINTTASYMLRRQDIFKKTSNLNPRDMDFDFTEALQKSKNLEDIERLVSPLIQSSAGRALVGAHTGLIAETCWSLYAEHPLSAAMSTLSLMNDLVISLAKEAIPLSPAFLDMGLNLSLKCGNFISAQRYIKACYEYANLAEDGSLWMIMGSFLKSLLKHLGGFELDSASSSGSTDVSRQLLEIYSLLTGWNLGQELGFPFMRAFCLHDYDMSVDYFACLARLGAFRTMWYEWSNYVHDMSATAVSKTYEDTRFDSGGEGVDRRDRLEDGKIGDGETQQPGPTEIEIRRMMSIIYAEAIRRSQGVTRNSEQLLRCVDFMQELVDIKGDRQIEVEGIIRLGQTCTGISSPGMDCSSKLDEEGIYISKVRRIFFYKNLMYALSAARDLLASFASQPGGRS